MTLRVDILGMSLAFEEHQIVNQVRHLLLGSPELREILGESSGSFLCTTVQPLGFERLPAIIQLLELRKKVLELDVPPRLGPEDEFLVYSMPGQGLLHVKLERVGRLGIVDELSHVVFAVCL